VCGPARPRADRGRRAPAAAAGGAARGRRPAAAASGAAGPRRY